MKEIKLLIFLSFCSAIVVWNFCSHFHVFKFPLYVSYDDNKFTLANSSFISNSKSTNFQVSNPLSPAYGMEFVEKYGFPTETEKLQNYYEVYSDWRPYFPNLMSSIAKRMKMNTTDDVITRTASINVDKRKFVIGGELEATLTSLDGTGRRKAYGGDLYRARLIRGHGKYIDAVPCKITDNNDGTYAIKVPLLLQGDFTLDVVLVTPLEGILKMIEETEKMLCDDRGYTATLQSKEEVICSASYDCMLGKAICDYSSPQNNATWICERPPSKKCAPIIDLKHDHELEKLKKRLKRVCREYGCHVRIRKTRTIKVFSSDKFVYEIYWANLPYCKELFHKNKINSRKRNSFEITGFGNDSIWSSFVCRNKELMTEVDPIQKCLNNKVIYYLGDSTTRKFFFLSAKLLKLQVVQLRDDDRAWQQPKVAYSVDSKTQNITVYFRCHGTPMQNPGPPDSRPFIADTISNIPVGGKDVFVVFNLGTHLYRFDPSMYIQRLHIIHKAIIRHHTKFPGTKFIVKGFNVATNDYFCWEWTVYRLEQILKAVFTNMNNVVFLDLWDFTTAWPLLDIHPPTKIAIKQWFLMHRLMCD